MSEMERQRYKPMFADKEGKTINMYKWGILQGDDDYVERLAHEIEELKKKNG